MQSHEEPSKSSVPEDTELFEVQQTIMSHISAEAEYQQGQMEHLEKLLTHLFKMLEVQRTLHKIEEQLTIIRKLLEAIR